MRTKSVPSIALSWSVPAVSAFLTTSGVMVNQFLDAHPMTNFFFLADVFIWHPQLGPAVTCWVAAVAGEAELKP